MSMKTAYKSDPAPKVVRIGSVSHPKPLGKWSPKTMVKDATPKIVRA